MCCTPQCVGCHVATQVLSAATEPLGRLCTSHHKQFPLCLFEHPAFPPFEGGLSSFMSCLSAGGCLLWLSQTCSARFCTRCNAQHTGRERVECPCSCSGSLLFGLGCLKYFPTQCTFAEHALFVFFVHTVGAHASATRSGPRKGLFGPVLCKSSCPFAVHHTRDGRIYQYGR